MKYLIDLDGTILDGKKANNDSVQFINELKRKKAQFVIMTNSIKSPQSIWEKLHAAGISLPINCILNPITAINAFLKNKTILKSYIVGSQFEIEQIVSKHEVTDPEIIILLDFEKNNITYAELQIVFSLIQKGISVIAASGSRFYLKNGINYLDTGSFVNLFETTGNIQVRIFGKPSLDYFCAGIALLDSEPSDITVIGDDWSTDIIGATNAECKSVLLKSGKYMSGDENKCEPGRVVKNLMDIFE